MKRSISYTIIFTTTFIFIIFSFNCSPVKNGKLDPSVELIKFQEEAGPRNKILFDFNWRFLRGDIDSGQYELMDDNDWRQVDLPHDWSIEDLPCTDSPIDSNAIGAVDAGFLVGGTGWYRKEFVIPEDLKERIFIIHFDGIYMNADIWLNEIHLGNHPYGYTSFWYDITKHIRFGETNLIAVEVKNEGKNSRWYSGSGIYRHVWITITDPVYIVPWGTYITTSEINTSSAKVNIKTRVNNVSGEDTEVILRTKIIDNNNLEVGTIESIQIINKSNFTEFEQNIEVTDPARWSVVNPAMYTAISEVLGNKNESLDKTETKFGIRTIEFNTEDGFLLNGKPILLKGGCMHHDNGPLGAAAYDRAEERRVELMKSNGFNAIRCAHNPPSPAFLDACDRLGIMVIDEAFDMWQEQNKSQDYHLYFDEWWQKDIESMVKRDRNHPSIIMWSTGNEIKEMEDPKGIELSKTLSDFVKKLDSTRPVTAAVNRLRPEKDPFFATLDIAGYNYAAGGDHQKKSIYVEDHERIPDRIMYGSESYPLEAFDSWMAVLDYSYVIGDFVWTGFDYLGEASIGWLGYMQKKSFYPWTHAFCGDIDICGFKRPQSFYRDVLWNNGQEPHIFVKPPISSFKTNPEKMDWSKWNWHDVVASWNWEGYEDEMLEVNVYNNSDNVELFLNGRSFGTKKTNRNNEYIVKWNVPYSAGTLKAVSYQGSQIISTSELITAGVPKRIKLSADRSRLNADGQDLSFIIVELIDSVGNRNPKSENLINFEVKGPGEIIGVGSSYPMGLESFQQPRRKVYQGRCLAILKSKFEHGTVQLTASSEGIESDLVEIVIR